MRIAIESPKTLTEQDVEEILDIWNRKPQRLSILNRTHTQQCNVQLFSECFICIELSFAHLNVCAVKPEKSLGGKKLHVQRGGE